MREQRRERGPGERDARRSGRRLRRSAAACLLVLVAASLGTARPASAATASEVAAITYDVAVLRPLNAAALALGVVFFAFSVPFVAPVEGIGTSWDVFVYAPYEYTVLRDLGDF